MDYEFNLYENGRLSVRDVSVDIPDVSDRWIGRCAFFAPMEDDLTACGLFERTRTCVDDNGTHYRLWRLTAKGKRALKAAVMAKVA